MYKIINYLCRPPYRNILDNDVEPVVIDPNIFRHTNYNRILFNKQVSFHIYKTGMAPSRLVTSAKIAHVALRHLSFRLYSYFQT